MNKILLYLDSIDPYFTQRLLLKKSIYVATIFVYFAWVFHIQDQFASFMYPAAILGAIYENAAFTSYKEKTNVYVITFFLAACGACLFYLTFQYKVIFVFIFIAFFSCLYFGYNKFLPKAKPFIVVTIVVCCMNMSGKPSGVIQNAIDIFGLIMLSMVISYLSIRTFPNYYYKVWIRAYRLYISAIREVLIKDLTGLDHKTFITCTVHMNIMRSYRRLLKKEMFYKASRAGFSIGNIFAIFACLEVTAINKQFWQQANEYLFKLSSAVESGCEISLFVVDDFDNLDKIEEYFIKHIHLSVKNWNALCKLI